MRGPEGAPAFAQSSRELKGLQRELRDAHALWCVLVLGFAGTGLALLSSLQCVAGLPVLLTLAFVWGRLRVVTSGCSWRGTLSEGREWRRAAAVRWRRRGVLLGGGFQELTGDGRVADGGGVVDPEHGGQVQRVAAAGEGFVELPVDPEALEGCGQSAAGSGEPVLAHCPGGHGGLLGGDQGRGGGGRPPAPAGPRARPPEPA